MYQWRPMWGQDLPFNAPAQCKAGNHTPTSRAKGERYVTCTGCGLALGPPVADIMSDPRGTMEEP